MKNYLSDCRNKLVAWLMAGVLWAGMAGADATVGSVIQLRGRVRSVSEQGQERTLKLHDSVALQDRIFTGPGAAVAILFKDDSSISMGESADMVIDDYVYDPAGSDSRSCFSMFKGVFRILTGSIVRLNPDRFRIQTSKTFIAIRGCEILLKITDDADYLYVSDLPEGHSVIAQAHQSAGGGMEAPAPVGLPRLPRAYGFRQQAPAPSQMVITSSGEGVIVGKTGVVNRHAFTDDELSQFPEIPRDDGFFHKTLE